MISLTQQQMSNALNGQLKQFLCLEMEFLTSE